MSTLTQHAQTLRRVRKQILLKNPVPSLWVWLQDRRINRQYATAEKRILIVRHAHKNPWVYHVVLDWLAREFPDTRAFFELGQIPYRVSDWSPYLLLVSWLPDPVQQWSHQAYLQAKHLALQCDEHGIPVVNRVEHLINAVKSTGSRLIGSVGIRTPKMAVIENVAHFKDTLLGLSLPLFVRENWGHGGNIWRADTMDEIRKMDLDIFSRPVAVEFIDTQNPTDGLYRKYRYIAAGEEGVTASLHVRKSWMVHGSHCEFSDDLREEELAFLTHADPNHHLFQQARKALDLDFVAFDYSYTSQGQLVVWEANPHPMIHLSQGIRMYRRPAVLRTFAAMVKLYLQKAGVPVPSRIDDILYFRE